MDSLRSPFGRLWRLSPLRGSDELPTRGFSEIEISYFSASWNTQYREITRFSVLVSYYALR